MPYVTLTDCRVLRAGPDSSSVNIFLDIHSATDTKLVGKGFWFPAHQEQQQEMLETALTALTTGLQVQATVKDPDPNVATGGTQHVPIETFYIMKA